MSLLGVFTKAGKAGEAVKKTAPFYSAVDEALSNLKRPKGTGIEFLTEVLKQPGVKKAEIADRKLEQAFKAKGKMTKEEAQQVLKENPPPQLKEKVYDDKTAIDEDDLREMVSQEMFGKPYSQFRFGSPQHRQISDEVYTRMEMDNGTQYGKYKTPDGENYREILLKLPQESSKITEAEKNFKLARNTWEKDPTQQNYARMQMAEQEREVAKITSSSYRSGHWEDDPNVLAHMRVQDRKGPNGEKILHVEEIQSDWHQAGRKKGYKPNDYIEQSNALDRAFNDLVVKRAELKDEAQRIGYFGEGAQALTDEANSITPKLMKLQEQRDELQNIINYGVPDAPFKKNWHELAMKRLLNYAADNGYDSIAITPGAEQAKRYDLSKQISNLQYDELGDLRAFDKDGRMVISENVNPEKLPDYVGKDLATKILSDRENRLSAKAIYRDALKNDLPEAEADVLYKNYLSHPIEYSGVDLEVGGEGMKGFYDKILPDYLNTFGKPYGAQMGTFSIPGDRGATVERLGVAGRNLSEMTPQEVIDFNKMVDEAGAMKLHSFPITPEMRESIKQKGLPLYQQVGIPTAGAGAASQAIQPEEELGLSGGGIINSAIKQAHLAKLAKMRQEMTPRAEAVKALISKDENSYLRDVVPNSLTNESIESEIARMKARAEAAQPEVKEAKGGVVRMTKNRDAMFMELSNKKLKRK